MARPCGNVGVCTYAHMHTYSSYTLRMYTLQLFDARAWLHYTCTYAHQHLDTKASKVYTSYIRIAHTYIPNGVEMHVYTDVYAYIDICAQHIYVRTHSYVHPLLSSSLVREQELLGHYMAVRNVPPEEWVGQAIKVYWRLDDEWYTCVVKQYHPHTRRHFLVYDDQGGWG